MDWVIELSPTHTVLERPTMLKIRHAKIRLAKIHLVDLQCLMLLKMAGKSSNEATTNNISPESDCYNMNTGRYSTW